MIELLKGRISDTEGLKEVLELIADYNEVSTAVLDIESEKFSGRIGIAWGKFITGALINEPQEKGKKALRQLLRLRQGKFIFNDLEQDPPIVELRQALGVDLLRTIRVVPELDPKEANFLWDANEKPEAEPVAEAVKPYIAEAEPVLEEPEWVEPEDEPEQYAPEIPETTEFATHDTEPVLPNFEQMSVTAVAEKANLSDSLPVPDISNADLATAYEIRRLPPKPGFEPTPALDAIFGSQMPDSMPTFTESALPKSFNPHSADSFDASQAEPLVHPIPRAEPHWNDPRPKLRVSSSRFEAIPIADESAASAEPLLPATSPPQVKQNAPMLQPNVVADTNFVGQRFVEPTPGVRPAPDQASAPDSGKVGQAIFCVILFVVSCASTILLGPRAWEFITSVLHH